MIPPIASRFVAGESAVSALERARSLNGRGIGAICNRLGEHYDDPAPAEADVREYCRLLAEFDSRELRACVSAKPTQLGLDVDGATFRANAMRVVAAAAAHDGFVWLDMEGPETTEATLDVFEEIAQENPGRTGVCLQANLRRTEGDIDRLSDVPGMVRLVKGAYDPPPGAGYRETEAVAEAYEARLEQLVRSFDGPDQGVAVGTHDRRLIERARALGAEHDVDIQVQLLMGVREDLQTELARELDVWQYVPYGGDWVAYFSRRLAERRENVRFALQALLGR